MAMEESPEEKAKNLVWEANRSGGNDNISVIVIAPDRFSGRRKADQQDE